MSYLTDVKKFQTKFGLADMPRGDEKDVILMRLNFLLEEIGELCDAVGLLQQPERLLKMFRVGPLQINREEALDALVDLAYVLFGTANLLGYEEVFDEAWRRVHEANMKKDRAVKVTKRGTTFDVVKPAGWVPADLGDLA